MHERLVLRTSGIVILLVAGFHTGFAQLTRPLVNDETIMAAAKARNDGRLLEAEKILQDAISEAEEKDPNSPRLAAYLRQLSWLDKMKGDTADEIALIQRVLEIDRAAFGSSDLQVGEDLDEIAMLSLRHGGNHEEAERLFKQGLAIAQLNMPQVRTGRDVDGVAGIFAQVAGFYIGEHRWTEAEPFLVEMKKLCDRMRPHPGVVLSCDGYPSLLEQLYRGEGRVAEAERQPPLDMGTPAELADLNHAAKQYENDGLYPQAEATYRRAITWVEAHPILSTGIGLGTGTLVYQSNLLGGVIEKQGRNDQAEAIYKEAIQKQETQDPRDPSIVANFDFHPLLNLYRAQGRISAIEPIVKDALAIQEERCGKGSPSVAKTLVVLADLYQEEGKEAKYAEARPLYERALEIEQSNVGPDHPRLVPVLANYCRLLRKLHEDAKAAEVQARIDRIERAQERARG